MKRSKPWKLNWKRHWLCLSLLGGSVAYLLFAVLIRANHLTALERIEQQTRQQLSINKASEEALDSYEAYHPVYRDYVDRGLIGTSNRLDWISTLDDLIQTLGLPNVKFSLNKTRETLEGDSPFFLYDTPIYITDMSLNVTLLHEVDLLRLLDEYQARSKGTFSIEQCEVSRISPSLEDEDYKGISANCKLRWFTLKQMYRVDSEALANVEDK